ncbi:ABC transporter ATP-binding protein [Aeromonas dhakensis]|uniref:ABC transporter ATP-binding protein n=1 Tax=Aeromonas dhakensis TaxID=196024 RepID=UPI001CF04121|nr:ABC transporter ATP-binding protein [Aeromonas dhakensis]MDD9308002.1 ABC transporter ATP-binding protein/permease [Aeromonas hydrophila]UCM53498.1 ABC transporter ATP-binding protein/permease [Aeromonas dhakensis]WPS55453.1 ABC transporter ATP-binding protein [Aeromonas dhakensis]WRT72998.1 ABC transporter ATP-binding protein [Aeromonas dhakensis]CAD7493448.1 ABC transporter [Aeromonas dhakensis]
MLNTFLRLLGDDAVLLRRYGLLALLYGLLCGLTLVCLIPVLTHLLRAETDAATGWLLVQLIGVLLCWNLRRRVEKASIAVGIAVLRTGRHALGEHVGSLPIGWFTPANTARLNHLASQGMMELAQLPAHVFTPLLGGVITPLVVLVALFALDVQLGLIALIALPLLVAVFLLTTRLNQHADQTFHQHAADTSQRMVEFAQAQSVLRAFNGEQGGTRFLEQAIAQQQASGRQLIRLTALASGLNVWAVQACFATLLLVAAQHLGGADRESLIAALVTLVLINRFIDPLLDVAGYSDVLRGARAQLATLQTMFDYPAQPQPATPATPLDGSVELRGVHFGYDPAHPRVLKGVDLAVAPGSMTALVGASGSGKSTVLRLIARFFDVDEGAVLVGGVDVRAMSGETLASHISQIFQDAYLFQGTIADNIRIGKPEASDAELLHAAHQAGVSEIVERLPLGLDTQVGEGGARLSGGERQRIAIARALLKDAPILLVDEATAALDAENQAAITETLARLRGKRTLIVIAHQLSTVAMADQIVVLDDGMVCEQGPHAVLSRQPGRYAHFLAQRASAKGWRLTGEDA